MTTLDLASISVRRRHPREVLGLTRIPLRSFRKAVLVEPGICNALAVQYDCKGLCESF
jgi:hypothetical protein